MTEPFAYALAGGGLVLLVIALIRLHARRINAAMANEVIVKIVRAGNLDRATKLCAAAPGSYLDAIGAALAALPASKDRVNVEAAVHGAFDPIAKQLEQRWHGHTERGLLGAMLIAAGVALQVTGENVVANPFWVAAAIAGLGGVWLLATRAYIARAVAAARRDVLPVVVEVATR
jgi:hypothetical protein